MRSMTVTKAKKIIQRIEESDKDELYRILLEENEIKLNIDEENIKLDLFNLGVTLGRKFSQIRVCYNIFIVGIMLTSLSLVFYLVIK